MRIIFSQLYVCVFVLLLYPGFSLAEVLQYEASYQGVLTAGKKFPIASVKLEHHAEALSDSNKALQITMEVSSRSYPFVEKRFPFRVRYRSLYDEEHSRLLALEKYKKTTKTVHEISWLDQQTARILRFRARGRNAGKRDFPAYLHSWLPIGKAFEFHKYAPIQIPENLLDYLSLLHMVRNLPLKKGLDYHFKVTDGKHLFNYRVRVEKRHQIAVRGKKTSAWKLRFDGTEEGEKKPDHRSLFVWIQDNDIRTPLLFENRHPLGRFVVSLTSVIQ